MGVNPFLISILIHMNAILADVNPSGCPNVDHTNRFPEELPNQENTYLCYAFNAKSLYEEEVCINQPHLCGMSISALDLSRCDWTLRKNLENEPDSIPTNEVGHLENALACGLANGACTEADFRFDKKFYSACFSSYEMADKTSCLDEVLLPLYKKTEFARVSEAGRCSLDSNRFFYDLGKGKVPAVLADDMAKAGKLGLDVKDILAKIFTSINDDGSYSEFLYDVMSTDSCRFSRFFPNHSKVRIPYETAKATISSKNYVGLTTDEKVSNTAQILKDMNRSVAITICSKPFFKKSLEEAEDRRIKDLENSKTYKTGYWLAKNITGKNLAFGADWKSEIYNWATSQETESDANNATKEDTCGRHVLVVNGSKFENGKCYFHFRNTWGESQWFNGWQEASAIMGESLMVKYINKKAP